jgi:hypothetical protein
MEDGTAVGALVAKAIVEIEPSLIPVSGSYCETVFVTQLGWMIDGSWSADW